MEVPIRLLEKWSDDDFDCRLMVSDDELECFITLYPEIPLSFTPDSLRDLLRKHGVVAGFHEKALEEVCEKGAQQIRVDRLLIASGTLPIDPIPAMVRFEVLISSDVPRYETYPDGSVNYHHANLFENVLVGDLLGVLIPEQSGIPGRSVLGRVLPPSIMPAVPLPRAGSGVELHDDGRFYATCDGRVIYDAGVVSISDEMVVEGDVDHGCGDIDFVGHVCIRGSVREGYTVTAGKGLVVDHVVESAVVESGGDVRIGGGAGDGVKGMIRCGGSLTARYLHEIHVECAGSLIVGNEIMNCHLRVGGSVQAALLAGGSTYATEGVDVKRLGSDAGERTYVRPGIGYLQLQSLDSIDMQYALFEQRKANLLALKDTGFEDEDEKEAVEFQLKDLAHELDWIDEERRSIYEGDGEGQNAKVNVRKAIYDGVIIHLGHTYEEIKDYRQGACSVIEHNGEELRFLPLTPLEKSAQDLEAELMLAEHLDG